MGIISKMYQRTIAISIWKWLEKLLLLSKRQAEESIKQVGQCQLKKENENLEVKITFYLGDKTEDFSPRTGFSNSSEDLLQRIKWGVGEGIQEFCNKDQVVRSSKDYY